MCSLEIVYEDFRSSFNYLINVSPIVQNFGTHPKQLVFLFVSFENITEKIIQYGFPSGIVLHTKLKTFIIPKNFSAIVERTPEKNSKQKLPFKINIDITNSTLQYSVKNMENNDPAYCDADYMKAVKHHTQSETYASKNGALNFLGVTKAEVQSKMRIILQNWRSYYEYLPKTYQDIFVEIYMCCLVHGGLEGSNFPADLSDLLAYLDHD